MTKQFRFIDINKTLLWLVTIATMVTLGVVSFRYSLTHLSDFLGYYTAARVIATEDSLSNLYDDAWFKQKAAAIAPSESTFVMYVNPPAVSFLMLPLRSLNPFMAKLIWNSFSLVLLIVAFRLGCRYFNLRRHSVSEPLLFGMLASTLPLFRNLQRGQVYVLMLVLVLLLLTGYQEKNPWRTGIPLSILILLKYFGWMFLVLFLVERRWKELCVTFLSFVIGLCITLAVTGVQTYGVHLQYLLAVFERNDFANTGLPSFQALFGALFVADSRFNPVPIADLPWLAQSLTILMLLGSLYFSLRKVLPGTPGFDTRPLAILVLSVVFTPLAADHHYLLIVPAAFLVASSFADSESHWGRAILMFAFFYALLGWYPTRQITQFDGVGKLIAFPRLYAGIVLWLIIILRDRRGTEFKTLRTEI